MFNIINKDSAYPNEYDRFVKMMSYALYEEQVANFQKAIKSVRQLADIVII